MGQMTIYHHLSPEERAFLMLERHRGSSLRQIALQLDRSPATLSRGIRRNSSSVGYCAAEAGKAYRTRRKRCVKPRKIISNQALRAVV
ncbi:IS30 family transposase, partial [Halieaceae bacterium IMCC14734]|nr:IS30 family transposase [Candidatus Litorirhabdus singularis]